MIDRTVQSTTAQAAESQEQVSGNGGGTATERRPKQTAKGVKRPRKANRRKKQPNKKGKGKGKARADDVIELTDSEEEADESPLSDLEEDNEELHDIGPIVPRRSIRRKKPRTMYREISDYEDKDNLDVQDEVEDVDVKP